MSDDILAICILLDDILQAIGHKEHARRNMSDAEVLTLKILASLYFGGNHAQARAYLKDSGDMPDILGPSRLNRRIHALSDFSFELMFMLGTVYQSNNRSGRYLIDSFPVAVCHNIRISRCKLLKGEQYRGKCVSKRTYFYGFKVFLITTEEGLPVELAFLPER